MSGPVWRYESGQRGTCDVCFRAGEAFFLEGEVREGVLMPQRRVCPDCLSGAGEMVVTGEVGRPSTSPAYLDRR